MEWPFASAADRRGVARSGVCTGRSDRLCRESVVASPSLMGHRVLPLSVSSVHAGAVVIEPHGEDRTVVQSIEDR